MVCRNCEQSTVKDAKHEVKRIAEFIKRQAEKYNKKCVQML